MLQGTAIFPVKGKYLTPNKEKYSLVSYDAGLFLCSPNYFSLCVYGIQNPH